MLSISSSSPSLTFTGLRSRGAAAGACVGGFSPGVFAGAADARGVDFVDIVLPMTLCVYACNWSE